MSAMAHPINFHLRAERQETRRQERRLRGEPVPQSGHCTLPGCHVCLLQKRGLTPKQIAVFSLICFGMMNKHIAQVLHITEETTKSQINTVCNKLGLDSKLAIIVWAQREGMI